jgi:hypothetical protein
MSLTVRDYLFALQDQYRPRREGKAAGGAITNARPSVRTQDVHVSTPKVKPLVAVVPRNGGIGLNEIQEFTQAMYAARRYGMACRDHSFRRSGKRGFNSCASCWHHRRTDRVAPMSERLSNP